MSNDKIKRRRIALIVIILIAVNLVVFGILYVYLSKIKIEKPSVDEPTDLSYQLSEDGTVTIDGITYKQKDDGNFIVIDCDENVVDATIRKKINESDDDNTVINEIGEKAFENCIYLTNVVIPDSMLKIDSYAFSGCTQLSTISIPFSVTEIGDSVFFECSSLTSIRIAVSNTIYTDYNGVLYSIDGKTLYAYPLKKTDEQYLLSDSVERIENNAFRGMQKLKSVALPQSLNYIGNGTFENCGNLTSVIILKNVTSIGKNAFNNCNSELKFYVESGSYAETYAKDNGIDYEIIEYKNEEQNVDNNNEENKPVDITTPRENVIEIL